MYKYINVYMYICIMCICVYVYMYMNMYIYICICICICICKCICICIPVHWNLYLYLYLHIYLYRYLYPYTYASIIHVFLCKQTIYTWNEVYLSTYTCLGQWGCFLPDTCDPHPFFHTFVRFCVFQGSELDAAVVLQLLKSEISVRSLSSSAPTVYTPRRIGLVLARMSLAGLVSTACTILPQDRFPKLMKKELERLRKVIRAFNLDTLGWPCQMFTTKAWYSFQEFVLKKQLELNCLRMRHFNVWQLLNSVCISWLIMPSNHGG